MANVTTGNTVRVHYTGNLDDGSEFDSSVGGDPLEFTVGEGQVIAGFESAVMGMEVGDEKSFSIGSDEAYGDRREELVMSVPREEFPADLELKPGQELQATNQNGDQMIIKVMEIGTEQVTVDLNHPLAGENLNFSIKLEAID